MVERSMEKRNRRAKTVLVIGIALVAVGILCCLATQITTYHTVWYPDGHGGVIPIQGPYYPYRSWWIPGVALLIVGPVVIAFSAIMMRRNKKRTPGDEQTMGNVSSTVDDELLSAPPAPELSIEREKALETRYCRYCGQSIPLDSDFCEKCGKRLTQ